MRTILIVNDDGIAADGICRLAEAAKAFGEVWVVAPDGQRSGVSHSITMHSPLDVVPHAFPVADVHAFACSGSPADCVRVGCLNIAPRKPDVVLCGINCGYNVASDIQYSATAGAAFEAAFQGCHSIALSEDIGQSHAVTDHYLHEILTELLEKPLAAGQIWNVNFPACPLSECGGILRERFVSRSVPLRDHYNVIEQLDGGGVRLMIEPDFDKTCEEGSDYHAVLEKYVSVGLVYNIR